MKRRTQNIYFAVWVKPGTREKFRYLKDTLKMKYGETVENALNLYLKTLHIEVPEALPVVEKEESATIATDA